MLTSPDRNTAEARKLFAQGKLAKAAPLLEEVLSNSPEHVQAHYLLGSIHAHAGRLPLSLEHLSLAHDLSPDDAEISCALANVLRQAGHLDKARHLLDEVLQRDDRFLPAVFEAGSLYGDDNDWARAAEQFRRAVELKPSHSAAQAMLALALYRLNDFDGARRHADKAVKNETRNALPFQIRARILASTGEPDLARRDLEKALKLQPTNGVALLQLASMQSRQADSTPLIRRIQAALLKGPSPTHCDHMQFALGKLFDDRGEWASAFAHFNRGNGLIRTTFDRDSMGTFSRDVRDVFEQLDSGLHSGSQAEPIFIVGMPRSGTTLLDRIVSGHDDVHSIGESMEMLRVTQRLASLNGGPYPQAARQLTAAQCDELAEHYLNHAAATPPATRSCDKMPTNFWHIGLILKLFPKARILHITRHPLDVGLSVYMTRFASTQMTWAWNLGDIGHFMGLYLDMMRFWHEALPGRILDVAYEDLVSDTPGQAQRILEHCGLPWQDACLDFHKRREGVNTASYMQVREPIYTRSLGRWHHYAAELQPLVNALGTWATPYSDELREAGLKLPLTTRIRHTLSGSWLKKT